MRILLLQARNPEDPAKTEELVSFAEKAGLPPAAFVSHDLLAGPPTLAEVQRYDALMVGGSGDYSVSEHNLPFMQDTLGLLTAVVEAGHPTFASCFGFHLITAALGGEVRYYPDGTEVGTYSITLTEAGQDDELFNGLPPVFPAQLGHKDYAARLPNGVVNLAFSASAPHQALRIPEKPIWATQFHPELSGEENLFRFNRYLRAYSDIMKRVELEETLARFHPSPASNTLIPRFIELITQP
jgi:GMP synthase (glutamine-hydrolysing)